MSSNLIALAFIGQMSRLGAAFYAFALLLLPVLAFVGFVTFQRLIQSSLEDVAYAQRIAGLRNLYRAPAPFESPVPFMFVRHGVTGDWKFFVDDDEWLAPDPGSSPGAPGRDGPTGPRRLRFRRPRSRAMSVTAASGIRQFEIDFPEARLAELRRRIEATRWPSMELVDDRSQGVQLATLKALADFWTSEYDWRACEARLNALPHYMTEIDGVDVHFIHVRSPHDDAMPLVMTHGWPGSVIELLEAIGPLTDPTAHGGAPEDAFHLVLPSLPGYGFSREPAELGWESGRIARAWAELMNRLGYTRYVAQGGDVGAAVTDAMSRQAPPGLAGVHINLLIGALAIMDKLPVESEQERAASDAAAEFRTSGFGYFLEQSTRPQTIGYSLLDSPVGLAAWLLDHDTDSYYKISRAFVEGQATGGLTRERILDNITLYWLTGTGASAARWYWESGRAQAAAAGQAPPPASVPVAFTTFPGEIFASPRSWAEAVYPDLAYFNEVDRGGHFAAWEEPELFSEEVRAAFRPLR